MFKEAVSEIALNDGCLHLVLASGGNDSYQFVYREAQSIYWDSERRSFKCSTTIPGLPLSEVFAHMRKVLYGFGISLTFPVVPKFVNVPDDLIRHICGNFA